MTLDRQRAFSLWVVVLAVTCTVLVEHRLNSADVPNHYVRLALIWLTGVFSYQSLATFLYNVGARNRWILRIFYGRTYLAGFWSYTSRTGPTKFLGVWKLEQDFHDCRVTGFGLDDSFGKRSSIASTAWLVAPASLVFINERVDWDKDDRRALSKTSVVPDAFRRWLFFFRYPSVLRGETELFGGAKSGQTAVNVVFRKHDDVDSFDELIEKLRNDRDLWRDQVPREAPNDPKRLQGHGTSPPPS
jgi:hypothetical protein